MTREEILSIENHCTSQGVSKKDYLHTQSIPAWKFYSARRRLFPTDDPAVPGDFLPLSPDGKLPVSPFWNRLAHARGKKQKPLSVPEPGGYLSVEVQTATGTSLRIQGEMNASQLQAILLASHAHV